jgi:hypothetical protein
VARAGKHLSKKARIAGQDRRAAATEQRLQQRAAAIAKKTRKEAATKEAAERDFFERVREYRKQHPDQARATPEEVEYIKKQDQWLGDAGRALDRAAAIRDGLLAPPWYRPSDKPPPKSPTKPKTATPAIAEAAKTEAPKPKLKRGAPRDYEHNNIIAVAQELEGVDSSRNRFFDRVREACKTCRPVVITPKNNRTMDRIIGDLYRQLKSEAKDPGA